MKISLSFLFLLLYLTAMFRPVAPLLEYVVHEDYIAEFLCVNKENAALNCKGKCYLVQQLAEQREEKKQNLPRIAMEEYPIGFVVLMKIQPQNELSVTKKKQNHYSNNYGYLFTASSFRPPNTFI
ncbi:MAG: hypothetical protein AAF634_06820 [Bacteroidota bacterium]